MSNIEISSRHPSDIDEQQAYVLTLHSQFINCLEWCAENVTIDDLKLELPPLIEQFCAEQAPHLSVDERPRLAAAILAETVGLGPLEQLLADPHVSDILVNGPREVFVERHGKLARTTIRFADDTHLIRIIQRLAARVGRRIDESNPTVDARLEDGSRVHAVIPPLAIRGATLSIRRFGHEPLSLAALLDGGSLTPQMAKFLAAAVEARVSFLISGGTGAGKTTLLNALSAAIPADERIVTIEDTSELQLQHPHVVSLETRNANTEGTGSITIRDLVRTSLRMRPDRILIGEVRGGEVLDMLQAVNTGHEGSLSTIHANDARDALSRLEIMVGMTGYDFPLPALRHYIASGIRLIVQVSRLKGGLRKVTRISEVVGLENGDYVLEDIFGFQQTGICQKEQAATGEFYTTGYVPRCLQRLQAAGISLAPEIFAVQNVGQRIYANSQNSAPFTAANRSQSAGHSNAIAATPAANGKPRKLKFKVANTATLSDRPPNLSVPAKTQQSRAQSQNPKDKTLEVPFVFEPILLGTQHGSLHSPANISNHSVAKKSQAAAVDGIMAELLQENKAWDYLDIYGSIQARHEEQ